MISADDIEAFEIPDGCVEDTIYLHSDKDDVGPRFVSAMTDAGKNIDDLSFKNARYAAYEVAIKGYWNLIGEFLALEINSVKLSNPTKL